MFYCILSHHVTDSIFFTSRKEYPVSVALPKSTVVDWTKKNIMELPYETYQRKKDKFFKSILTLSEEKFTCIRWEKSKKFAEQSAALAFLTLREMKTGKRVLSSNMKLDPT